MNSKDYLKDRVTCIEKHTKGYPMEEDFYSAEDVFEALRIHAQEIFDEFDYIMDMHNIESIYINTLKEKFSIKPKPKFNIDTEDYKFIDGFCKRMNIKEGEGQKNLITIFLNSYKNKLDVKK